MLEASTFMLMMYGCFTLQEPAVVAHHIGVKTSLVSLLRRSYILMKSLSMLIANISKVIWKEFQMSVESAASATYGNSFFDSSPTCCQSIRHNYLLGLNPENSVQLA